MIAINNNVNQMNVQLTEKVNEVATSISASTAEVTDLQVKVKEQGDNITLLENEMESLRIENTQKAKRI